MSLVKYVEEILKGKKAQIGETRTWGGKKYTKISATEWTLAKEDGRPHAKTHERIKTVTEHIKNGNKVEKSTEYVEKVIKGCGFPVGTQRTWQGNKYIKHQDGWVRLGGKHHGKLKTSSGLVHDHKDQAKHKEFASKNKDVKSKEEPVVKEPVKQEPKKEKPKERKLGDVKITTKESKPKEEPKLEDKKDSDITNQFFSKLEENQKQYEGAKGDEAKMQEYSKGVTKFRKEMNELIFKMPVEDYIKHAKGQVQYWGNLNTPSMQKKKRPQLMEYLKEKQIFETKKQVTKEQRFDIADAFFGGRVTWLDNMAAEAGLEYRIGDVTQDLNTFWKSIIDGEGEIVEYDDDSNSKVNMRFKKKYGVKLTGFNEGFRRTSFGGPIRGSGSDAFNEEWEQHVKVMDMVFEKMPEGLLKNNELIEEIVNNLDKKEDRAAASYNKGTHEIKLNKGSLKDDYFWDMTDPHDVHSFYVECLVHEIGHGVHYKLQKKSPSLWAKWKEQVGWKPDVVDPPGSKDVEGRNLRIRLVSGYAGTNPQEAFSETFAVYFTHKKKIDEALDGKSEKGRYINSVTTGRKKRIMIEDLDSDIMKQFKWMRKNIFENKKMIKALGLSLIMKDLENIIK